MPTQLNHTIVNAHNKHESARFYCDLLGLPDPVDTGHFVAVQVSNGVTLDFADRSDPVPTQHYAFLVEEPEFDAILERIRERNITFFADPGHQRVGEWNTNHGGRGLYWNDPSGHNLEILTRP